jgi:hypothetical protein
MPSVRHAAAAPFALVAVPLQSSDDGLTAAEILAAVPHDAAAIVVYTLVAACVVLVWWAHRHAGVGGREREPDAPPQGAGRGETDRRPRRAA